MNGPDCTLTPPLLLYKSKAVRQLGLVTAARDTLAAAPGREKDCSADLLNALHREDALIYTDPGQNPRAHAGSEKF